MRHLVLSLILAGWTATTTAASDPYLRLLEKTNLAGMFEEFPAEMLVAANRHAKRCATTAAKRAPTAADLTHAVTFRLRQNTSSSEVKQLVDWYVSSTGRKVRKLERAPIDEKLLAQHQADPQRLAQIRQIYHHTATGRFIANVAVEIEYAGWRLSGCMQSAASSGDLKRLKAETVRAQVIKGEAQTLLDLFTDDTVRSMEFALSSLSDAELTEYANTVEHHASTFSLLIDTLLAAIESETRLIKVSALP